MSHHGLLKLHGQIFCILREKIVGQDINVYLMNFQIMFSNIKYIADSLLIKHFLFQHKEIKQKKQNKKTSNGY